MFFGLNNFLKKILPKGLFYRSLIIVAAPTILLQLIVTIVFFDSIWIKANKGMTRSLVGEIKTLNDLAEQLDRSVGWLSQVERNVSEPALDDIRKIAGLFSLPVSFFFTDAAVSDEAAYIVRAGSRRIMSDAPKGLAESLLSPDLGGAFEIVHSVFAPGAACPEPFVRPTEEAGYVLEGSLVLFIDGVRFELYPGDSFHFAGEEITWINEGKTNAVLIWVIAPPVY